MQYLSNGGALRVGFTGFRMASTILRDLEMELRSQRRNDVEVSAFGAPEHTTNKIAKSRYQWGQFHAGLALLARWQVVAG